jgi:hypothetical protein
MEGVLIRKVLHHTSAFRCFLVFSGKRGSILSSLPQNWHGFSSLHPLYILFTKGYLLLAKGEKISSMKSLLA